MSIGERICLIVVLLSIVVIITKQMGINDGLDHRLQAIEAQQVAAVRVDYQDAGAVVCPAGNNVYRSTVGVYGGAEIFCLPQGIAPPTGAVQIGTIPGEGE